MKKTLLLIIVFIITIPLLKAQTLPAGYIKTTFASGIQYAVDFDWLPDGRVVATQKGDNSFPASNAFIKIFSSAGTLIGNFYDLTDSVDSDFERGLLGIAVDPNFTTNHYIYAYYDYRKNADYRIRVVRFTEAANVGTNPTLILNIPYPSSVAGNHFGGIIRFRPSDPTRLYITIGDLAYNQGDPVLNYANKLDKPFGKILRINTDGTIPTSNPFYDDGDPTTLNDDRIWSYGHRNDFGMTFNPVTDSMYASENGLNTWDEFNIIHKGGNYGWATCEGNYVYGTNTPCTGFINPIIDWGTPLPAVTGCVYYTSTLMPEFTNHILVGDNNLGSIYDLTMGNAPNYDVVTNKVEFATIATDGLTTLRQGADGCIYAMEGGYVVNGTIYKICPTNVGIAMNNQSENILGQNYPNPAIDKTLIDYSVSQKSTVIIELFDVTGRKLKNILNTEVLAGKSTVDISDCEKYAGGSYFYKMQVIQNNKLVYSETKRMIISK